MRCKAGGSHDVGHDVCVDERIIAPQIINFSRCVSMCVDISSMSVA